MKKLCLFVVLSAFAMAMYAEKDVTTFLGIPVDGTKSEMIQKLERKGYVYDYKNDHLTGEFNGRDVAISVVTNNNKVYRIVVRDYYPSDDEGSIITRFNVLCRQFSNNSKYDTSMNVTDYTIPDDEDISYEMSVNNKQYQAAFYQQIDTTIYNSEYRKVLAEYVEKMDTTNIGSNIKELAKSMTNIRLMDAKFSKLVWFTISKFYGKYYLLIYYDNKYNQANGEDL